MSQVRSNDANNTNVNRIVRFNITASAVGNAAIAANTFAALEGPNYNYKRYGKVNNPTQAQILAQLRTSLVTRVISQYAILVGVQVADALGGPDLGSGLRVEMETDRSGIYYNNDWSTDQTQDKHEVLPITDTVGIGGMNVVKTKPGLQQLLDTLGNVSYDDGVTFVFGGPTGAFDSSAVAVTLPDGTSANGPRLDDAVGGVSSGLVITWDNPAVI